MTTIFHASDIHFGRVKPEVVRALLMQIESLHPDMTVISGDFTQTGTPDEFKQAQDFLSAVPGPVFTVPGNHDIPYKNILHRFFSPYARYKKYINEELCPVFEDDHLVMVGINTARRILPHWNWAHGKVSKEQVEFVRKTFTDAPQDKFRVLVCHHPLIDFSDMPIKTLVWGRDKLREALLQLDVHMVLTGHIHQPSLMYDSDESGRISFVGAATATSSRLRLHQNGYNLIKIKDGKADIKHRTWNGQAFETLDENTEVQRQQA